MKPRSRDPFKMPGRKLAKLSDEAQTGLNLIEEEIKRTHPHMTRFCRSFLDEAQAMYRMEQIDLKAVTPENLQETIDLINKSMDHDRAPSPRY